VAGAVAGTVDNREVEGESEDVDVVDDAPPTPPDDDLSVVVVELVVLVFVLDLSLSRL